MGFFDFLGGGGDATQKHVAKLTNKYAQSDTRFRAMEKLLAMGTEDALVGLCRRFSFKYDKTIEDEQEKSFAVQSLVAKGKDAVPAVRRFMKDADSLSWPLRVLEKIAAGGGHEDVLLATVDDILSREEPGYTRDPGRKLELLGFLSELTLLPRPEIARRIVPYLADFDQDVRAAAAEALGQAPEEAVARLPLIAAMIRPEEEVRRVRVGCAEVLAAQKWPVAEQLDTVKALLGGDLESFTLVGDILQKKGA